MQLLVEVDFELCSFHLANPSWIACLDAWLITFSAPSTSVGGPEMQCNGYASLVLFPDTYTAPNTAWQ
jgi:hypothetical protein